MKQIAPIGKSQVLARIDNVSTAIEKAEPEQLGKAIRLLDAMKRLAVGKKWVDTIGQADAWSLKARRRAGEIVEASDSYPAGRVPNAKSATGTVKTKSPRSGVRQELGITEHESTSWQALAKIPKPVFDDFTKKVEAREEDGTISNALAFAKAEAGEPEIRVVHGPRTHEEILIEDLTKAGKRFMDTAGADILVEVEDKKQLRTAIEFMEGTIMYLQTQLKKLVPKLDG